MGWEAALIFLLKVAVVTGVSIGVNILLAEDAPAQHTTTTVSIRQPDAPRRLLYGRRRIGTIMADIIGLVNEPGKIVGLYSNELKGEQAANVLLIPYILCEGEIEEIESIYLNDEIIELEPLDYTGRTYYYDPRTESPPSNAVETGSVEANREWVNNAPRIGGQTPILVRDTDGELRYYYYFYKTAEQVVGRAGVLTEPYAGHMLIYPHKGFEFQGQWAALDPNAWNEGNERRNNNFRQTMTLRRWIEGLPGYDTLPIDRTATQDLMLAGTYTPRLINGEFVFVWVNYADESSQFFVPGSLNARANTHSPGALPSFAKLYELRSLDHTLLEYHTEYVAGNTNLFRLPKPPAIWYHYTFHRLYYYDAASQSYRFWCFIDGTTGDSAIDYNTDYTQNTGFDPTFFERTYIPFEHSTNVFQSELRQFYFQPNQPYLNSIAYLGIRYDYDLDAFGGGVPEVSAIVKGKNDVYDPRDNTRKWTDNPALILADYMANEKFGLNIENEGMNSLFPNLADAADTCDELIETAQIDEAGNPIKKKRYTCNALLTTDRTHKDNIETILASMAGTLNYVDGKWYVYAGVYRQPTFDIEADMVIQPPERKLARARRENANTIQGTFVDANADYQSSSYPSQIDVAARERDGQIVATTANFAAVTSSEQAQRLAHIKLQQAQHSKSLTLSLDARAMQVAAGDIVRVNIPRLGFQNAEFQVMQQGFTFNSQVGVQVDLQLQEYSEAIFAWDAATQEQTPATAIRQPSTGTPIEPPTPDPTLSDDLISAGCVTYYNWIIEQGDDPADIPFDELYAYDAPEGHLVCDASMWATLINADGEIEGLNIEGWEDISLRP